MLNLNQERPSVSWQAAVNWQRFRLPSLCARVGHLPSLPRLLHGGEDWGLIAFRLDPHITTPPVACSREVYFRVLPRHASSIALGMASAAGIVLPVYISWRRLEHRAIWNSLG